jgi:ferritin-like protein
VYPSIRFLGDLGGLAVRFAFDLVCRACSSTSSIERETGMSSEGYHEPVEELSVETRDMHKAIVSLMEELEAVDWYNQRADACRDPELKAILEHNRDEEKEHAAMVLEWIRRKDPKLSSELKDYLFTTKPIAHK